jgi:hypothetical protein
MKKLQSSLIASKELQNGKFTQRCSSMLMPKFYLTMYDILRELKACSPTGVEWIIPEHPEHRAFGKSLFSSDESALKD